MPLPVHIKHAGKVYDIELNPDLPASAFKNAIYQVTGVPLDRMKVMIKGGVLKDDTDWKRVAPKAGQTFMVIGAAGELPKPPEKPLVFLEDLDDAELAEALVMPVGLYNLGNTCYMNATIQALRAIPELQIALNATTPSDALSLSLRDLYAAMARTTNGVSPIAFVEVLRSVNPQFAETTRGPLGHSFYAQQDAEECYGTIIQSLRNIPGFPTPSEGSGSSENAGATPATARKKFIEQYMTGEMRRELKCDEAADEPMTFSTEKVLKIECNITIHTNYMFTGIMNSLDQKVEKNSPSLGRQAVYSQHSRLTRFPAYLMVHMVRFAWREDILKKAKIMRKVKFPLELDALDLATEELKQKMLPVNRRLQAIEKERGERRKVRRKMKNVAPVEKSSGDVNMTDAVPATTTPVTASVGTASVGDAESMATGKADGELEDESVYRAREIAELETLVHSDVRDDVGCSASGLYELVAIVTHKGAAADGGHYIGYVKKSVLHPSVAVPDGSAAAGPSSGAGSASVMNEDDEDWYQFDDNKVSVFPVEKIGMLDGGGEDSSAYVLLYKTRSVL